MDSFNKLDSADQSVAVAQAQKQAFGTVTTSTSVKRSERTTVTVKSHNRTSPRAQVCRAAKRMFGAQLEKNTETKRRCLNHNINRYYGNDAPRFWHEMKTEAESICDSKLFCKRCEDKGLNPQWVAEHLLVEGTGVAKRVLKEGFESLHGTEMLFDAPLIREEDLKSQITAA